LRDARGPGRDGGPSRFHQLAPMRAHAAEQLRLDGEAAIVAERRNGWARALLLSGPRPGRPGQAAFYQQIGDSHRTITDSMFAAAGTGPCDQDVFAVARLLPYWIDRMIPADPLRISTALARSVTDANGPLARAAAVLVRGAVLAANQQASVVHDELLRATADIRQVSFDQADAGCWTQIADLLIVTASCCWIGDDFELTATIAHLADDHANHLDDPDLRLCAAMFGCLTGLWEDPASAAATATELSAQSHAIGNDLTALMASVTCSIAALLEGDGVVGLHWTAAALRLQRTLGVRSIADTLETRGNHYVTAGQPVEAVRCYGAAHLQQYRQGRPWPHHPGTGRRLDAAREALSLKDFANAWAEGERIGAADLIEDWL
ncbi:MAG: hypothetical protein L0H26_12765, partial [Microlunatus sp.]|nr:hypothetical protein [Microlunatus sp.]